MMRKALFVVGVLIAGSALAAPERPDAPADTLEIVAAEFGVFDASDTQATSFVPTRVVPHQVGQRYGWIIEVRSARRSLSVREEYVLAGSASATPKAGPLGEVLDFSQQRRNQVSQRLLVPVDGAIYGEWAIGPNEPSGHRHLRVVIEDQVAVSFEYEVK